MSTTYSVSLEERSDGELKTRTFSDEHGNVEFILLTHGKVTVGLSPKTESARQNGLSDDAYECLKACREIRDDNARIQCIALCPPNKDFEVLVGSEFISAD